MINRIVLLGELVQVQDGRIAKVMAYEDEKIGVRFHDSEEIVYYPLHNVSSITLTGDILEDNGFKKSPSNSCYEYSMINDECTVCVNLCENTPSKKPSICIYGKMFYNHSVDYTGQEFMKLTVGDLQMLLLECKQYGLFNEINVRINKGDQE